MATQNNQSEGASDSKSGRTVRLDDAQHRFLDQSTFDFGAEARDWLDGQRVNNAAGTCADCGSIVYIGGHTVVSGGSPLGNALNLGTDEEIDLCPVCYEEISETFQTEADPSFDLQYFDGLPNYYIYRTERDAVIRAQADSEWAHLITHREDLTARDRIQAIYDWVNTIDFEKMYNQNTRLDAQAVLDAIYAEKERQSIQH